MKSYLVIFVIIVLILVGKAFSLRKQNANLQNNLNIANQSLQYKEDAFSHLAEIYSKKLGVKCTRSNVMTPQRCIGFVLRTYSNPELYKWINAIQSKDFTIFVGERFYVAPGYTEGGWLEIDQDLSDSEIVRFLRIVK